jgi:hypothetical protein
MAQHSDVSHRQQKRRAERIDGAGATFASGPAVSTVTPPREIIKAAAPPVEGFQWNNIDLGPELPMSVFTSMEVWQPERIGALAIYCSDGRWGEAFDEFCHKRLQIPRYDRLAIAGGPAWLTGLDGQGDDLRQALRQQLSFLVKVHELERIVLINHHGCAVYRERLQLGPDECLPKQMDDLRMATATLHGWFPDVRVEAYLAMRRGSHLSFHWLNPPT